MAGALLSQGSPLGALALRALAFGVDVRVEVVDFAALYVYMSLGTLVAFSAFGWLLGRTVDRIEGDRCTLRLLNRQLRWLSSIDPLTGVLNRRALEHRLTAELERAERQGTPTSLIMVDLDHFKDVNDRHGHLLGDRVLRAVARRLRRTVRRTDVVGRFGGEEFLVVLPDTRLDRALSFAERLRHQVARKPFKWRDSALGLTISLGVSLLPPWGGTTAGDGVAAADKALYRAKNAGRNRVCGP